MNSKPLAEFSTDVDHIVQPVATHFRGRPVTPEAVLWPNSDDLVQRYAALTHLVRWDDFSPMRRLRLLDVGCGPGFLVDHLVEANLMDRVDYTGVDLNSEMISAARARHGHLRFELRDVTQEPFEALSFDLAILCGIFTARFELSNSAMQALVERTLSAVWPSVADVMAFNVMSKHVDWERNDLFHYSVDDAIEFSFRKLKTRNVLIRHDYGLYEYSCLVQRAPRRSSANVPASWRA